jgi:hypothetical protein
MFDEARVTFQMNSSSPARVIGIFQNIRDLQSESPNEKEVHKMINKCCESIIQNIKQLKINSHPNKNIKFNIKQLFIIDY